MPLEEERDEDDELLTEEEDLLEDELLTEEPEFLLLSCEPRDTLVEELRRLLSWELLDTLAPLLRLLSCELLETEEPELLVEELVLRVEDEPELLVEEDPEVLAADDEELLDEDLVWEEVVLLLDPEERLSCEYESTGAAIRANATADAIAMFRMFFILIRC